MAERMRFIHPQWYTQRELDDITIETAEGDLGAMEIDADLAALPDAGGPEPEAG